MAILRFVTNAISYKNNISAKSFLNTPTTMSEFQLYDFRKIDQPLSNEERKRVQGLSSHINVSSRRAVVSYSYGDFKHNEETVVEQYFDALLYQTNWGQKKLVFRFPKDSIDYQQLGEYDIDRGSLTGYTTEIRVWKSGGYVLVNIEYCEDGYEDWVEENDNSLDSMLQLRTEMMNGDFSCLYAFWLKLLQMQEESDDDDADDEYADELPAIPLGLAKPSAALQSFTDFFDINPFLIKTAGSFIEPAQAQEIGFISAIESMTDETKNEWLGRLVEGEPLLDIKLKKYLVRAEKSPSQNKPTYQEIASKL